MYEYCMDCGKGFTSEWALTQHFIQSPRHLYCRFCDVHFREAYELHDHNSSRHGHCTVCSKLFETKEGLHQHSRQSHWYCEPCRQTFASQNNLNMHLRTSPAHNPRSNVCPGRNCGRSFMRYADLAAHLESGTCSGGFNRQNLNRMVIRADTSNIVTNPARLIGYRENSQVMNIWATPNSWNGYGYECALCHKEFRILSALNAHLNSPAHEARIYRCPTQYNGCAGEYRTLSALLSHIERSECGVARFRKPLTLALDNAMSGARRLTFN